MLANERGRNHVAIVGAYIFAALGAVMGGLTAASGELWKGSLQAILVLVSLCVPRVLAHLFHVRLPFLLELLGVLFIFLSGVLGEIYGYYEKYALWDNLLHFLSGFLFCAFGYSFTRDAWERGRGVSLFHRSFYAFSFAMAAGCIWEFIEHFSDKWLKTDMQKDTLLRKVYSSYTTEQGVVGWLDAGTEIRTHGMVRAFHGYLDIGLKDTMVDLMMGCMGAILFALWAYADMQIGRKNAQVFVPTQLPKNVKEEP